MELVEQPKSTVEEVLENRSPKEVEKELLDQAEKQALDEYNKLTPQQRAAINFKMLFPAFQKAIYGFSNKELRKVIENLVIGDLSKDPPVVKKPVAEALKIGSMLIDFRLIINGTNYLEQLEKIHEQSKIDTASDATINQFAPGDVITTIEYPEAEQTKEQNTNNG